MTRAYQVDWFVVDRKNTFIRLVPMDLELARACKVSDERHAHDALAAHLGATYAECLMYKFTEEWNAPTPALRVVAHTAHACSLPMLRPTRATVVRDLAVQPELQKAFVQTIKGIHIAQHGPPLATDADWAAWIESL